MGKILAIESSCDESSISLIKNNVIIDTITFSQEKEFASIGGVVPELAARMHENNLPLVLEKLITKHNFDLNSLNAIAVTTAPGLIGCLQMGLQMGKTLSAHLNIPLIDVHHLAGHIYSGEINNELKYPLLSLVVSGGNTQLILVEKEMEFKIIGQTLDDAIGECFDKVARVIGFDYPGGPKIDKAALTGKANIDFPISNIDGYNFSYSGLKSSVLNYVNNLKMKKKKIPVNNIAKSFQNAAIKQLENKTLKAIAEFNVKQLVVVGGVSANSQLRSTFNDIDVDVIFPKLEYCTDNAAMIAKVAHKKYEAKLFGDIYMKATPNESIKF